MAAAPAYARHGLGACHVFLGLTRFSTTRCAQLQVEHRAFIAAAWCCSSATVRAGWARYPALRLGVLDHHVNVDARYRSKEPGGHAEKGGDHPLRQAHTVRAGGGEPIIRTDLQAVVGRLE